MECTFDMEHVMLAHGGANSVSMPVTLDGESYRLRGEALRVLDFSVRSVILLADFSTPTSRVLDNEAALAFDDAAAKLIRTGQEFYTQLRPNWALPAVRWSKVE